MRKLFLMLAMLMFLGISNAYSQEYKRNGDTFTVTSKTQTKSEPVKTKFVYEKNGVKYPIYISSTGSCFVVRTSKKGKEYKQYLGKEISAEICKELGIEYKPKK